MRNLNLASLVYLVAGILLILQPSLSTEQQHVLMKDVEISSLISAEKAPVEQAVEAVADSHTSVDASDAAGSIQKVEGFNADVDIQSVVDPRSATTSATPGPPEADKGGSKQRESDFLISGFGDSILDQVTKLERSLRETERSKQELQRILEEANSVSQNREKQLQTAVLEVEAKLQRAENDLEQVRLELSSAISCDASAMKARDELLALQIKRDSEVNLLQEKIEESQKNASMLAIKMRIAKNERNVAQTSLETSELELESCSVECAVEKKKLQKEISTLRRSLEREGCPAFSLPQSTGIDQTMEGAGCNWRKCFDPSQLFRSSITGSYEVAESADKTFTTSQDLFDAAVTGQQWLQRKYWMTVHPVLYTVVGLQYELLFRGAQYVWQQLIMQTIVPAFRDTIIPSCIEFYSNVVVPWITVNVYPTYQQHLEAHVNATYSKAAEIYERDVEAVVDKYLYDPYDFIVGRVHFVAYFTLRFFTDDELLLRIQESVLDWLDFSIGVLPELVRKVANVPIMLDIFEDNAVIAAGAAVYGSAALVLFLMRRIVFGIASLLLIVVLFPSLAIVFIIAKLASMLRPRSAQGSKRSARSAGKAPRAARTAVDPSTSFGHTRSGKTYRSPTNKSSAYPDDANGAATTGTSISGDGNTNGGASGVRYMSRERGEAKPQTAATSASGLRTPPRHSPYSSGSLLHGQLQSSGRSSAAAAAVKEESPDAVQPSLSAPPGAGPPTLQGGNNFQYKGAYPAYRQVELDKL